MDAELKSKWVAALRGGEYKQIRGSLRSESGFCCLGVLCDTVDPQGWDHYGLHPFAHGSSAQRTSYAGLIAALDTEGTDNVSELWGKNDGGMSFLQIADWIEENL